MTHQHSMSFFAHEGKEDELTHLSTIPQRGDTSGEVRRQVC